MINQVDLLFCHGTIWTGDPRHPNVEAIVVQGDRIMDVVYNHDLGMYQKVAREVIDLQGKFVTPGFIDTHTHFTEGGVRLNSLDFGGVSSKQEFIQRISEVIKTLPPNAWIIGGNWDHELFPGHQLPCKEWIDEATSHNPVCLSRRCGHMILTNSLALKMAGISKETKNPAGGIILQDPAIGEPTGILKDSAMKLVLYIIPPVSLNQKTKTIKGAMNEAVPLGLTSVHAMDGLEDVEAYSELYKKKEMTIRVRLYLPIRHWQKIKLLRDSIQKNPFLAIQGVKGFADGSLGSSTALFYEPYADDPENYGLAAEDFLPMEKMAGYIKEADAAGLQAAIHAIGDKANAKIIDIFEANPKTNGSQDRRFRIEHAQHLQPQDIPRFAKNGIIAAMQPYHCLEDGCWAERKIGSERLLGTYAFRSLIDVGAIIAFGSDWTVAPLNPMLGVYAAATRATINGKNPMGWIPEQKITVDEALRCYTRNAAYAQFSEKELGCLAPNYYADLVIWSADPRRVSPEEIKSIRAVATYVGGKRVYGT